MVRFTHNTNTLTPTHLSLSLFLLLDKTLAASLISGHHHCHRRSPLYTTTTNRFPIISTLRSTTTRTYNPFISFRITTKFTTIRCFWKDYHGLGFLDRRWDEFSLVLLIKSWPRVTTWWYSDGLTFVDEYYKWVLVENMFSTKFGIRVSWLGRGWLETESKLSA